MLMRVLLVVSFRAACLIGEFGQWGVENTRHILRLIDVFM
jgi:hypothetical protein